MNVIFYRLLGCSHWNLSIRWHSFQSEWMMSTGQFFLRCKNYTQIETLLSCLSSLFQTRTFRRLKWAAVQQTFAMRKIKSFETVINTNEIISLCHFANAQQRLMWKKVEEMHFKMGLDVDWKTFEEFNGIAVHKEGMLSKCISLHVASSFKLIWTIQWMRRQNRPISICNIANLSRSASNGEKKHSTLGTCVRQMYLLYFSAMWTKVRGMGKNARKYAIYFVRFFSFTFVWKQTDAKWNCVIVFGCCVTNTNT